MPLWQLFVPENAYTPEDKQAIATRITDIYEIFELPRFYTSVFFHELNADSFQVGARPRDKFVQVAIVHAARTAEESAERLGITVAQIEQQFLAMANNALEPFVKDRGYEWELHVEAVARETWQIDGMAAPPQWSDDEKQWRKDDHSSPYGPYLVAAGN